MKALAIYRDGSQDRAGAVAPTPRTTRERASRGRRRRCRSAAGCRASASRVGHKFSIGDHEGYINVGMYEDGTVGEIFLTDIGKEGSTLRGPDELVRDRRSRSGSSTACRSRSTSRSSRYMRFEPAGITNNPEIPFAKSMPDYIIRWLGKQFLDRRPAGGARDPLARR